MWEDIGDILIETLIPAITCKLAADVQLEISLSKNGGGQIVC